MMNIETLLQAAQILESQQAIPPKKRLARDDRPNGNNPVPTSVLSPTTINTNPNPIILSTSTTLKSDPNDEYLQRDLNLNLHHQTHLAQQRLSSDQNDDDDDDDDDESNNQNVNRNNELSTKTQTSCIRDREIHNRLEKHRRAHLKDCFDSLKAEVPCQRDRKITNLQVLNLAIKYIQRLTRKEREYDREMNILTSRNAELQQRLNCLKSDLNADGHNVESWLESCSEMDCSASTQTASEAEMYRTFDEHDDRDGMESSTQIHKKSSEDSNQTESKSSGSSRKSSNASRQRLKPNKRKLQSIPTTNLLQTLSTYIPNTSSSENLLDFSVVRHLQLDEPCNLLTNSHSRTKDSISLTPITDIRYDIVDLFTKGTSSHLQQNQQQISPLPSIASLMNRHSSQPSPVVSPTKQTIGINTDLLTTSTTNILHQPVATS